MKYYLIVGEASGDLHASRLMKSLRKYDENAEFRFFGGDLMAAEAGCMPVKHYKTLAYMGFIPVLLHLRTILKNMRACKQDIARWQPDAVILVDYPGFNLSIAKEVRKRREERGERREERPQVYYYISPKIWAWKEYRIKNIKRDVDELFSILPFEVDFFERKHHYPIHYVGNPTADEVREFLGTTVTPLSGKTIEAPSGAVGGAPGPIIAILCGSRKQEIKDNLPAMLQVTDRYSDRYDVVIAGAPSVDAAYYEPFLQGHRVRIVFGQTYELLSRAHAALVTSGTATLETALLGVPQVVCYETPLPRLIGYLRKKILKVPFISLVNLIAGREVVRELVADTFTVDNIDRELRAILDGEQRETMLQGYREVWKRLGTAKAPDNAARLMMDCLNRK